MSNSAIQLTYGKAKDPLELWLDVTFRAAANRAFGRLRSKILACTCLARGHHGDHQELFEEHDHLNRRRRYRRVDKELSAATSRSALDKRNFSVPETNAHAGKKRKSRVFS
jgi:hypothetical protein